MSIILTVLQINTTLSDGKTNGEIALQLCFFVFLRSMILRTFCDICIRVFSFQYNLENDCVEVRTRLYKRLSQVEVFTYVKGTRIKKNSSHRSLNLLPLSHSLSLFTLYKKILLCVENSLNVLKSFFVI